MTTSLRLIIQTLLFFYSKQEKIVNSQIENYNILGFVVNFILPLIQADSYFDDIIQSLRYSRAVCIYQDAKLTRDNTGANWSAISF